VKDLGRKLGKASRGIPVLAGAGVSVTRSTDRIRVTDASGAPVPRYDFD